MMNENEHTQGANPQDTNPQGNGQPQPPYQPPQNQAPYQPPYQAPPYQEPYQPQYRQNEQIPTAPGEEKVYNILSYITILWLVGLLAAPHNPRVRFHVNQGITLSVFQIGIGIVSGVVLGVLGFVLGILPSFITGIVMGILHFLFGTTQLALFAIMIVGIMNAIHGRDIPLPVIGRMFRFLK